MSLFALALAVIFTIGCAPPQQAGSDQVPDYNILYTGEKDKSKVGMPSEVDAIIDTFLSQEGASPGLAIGIMIDNEIAYLKGYGVADLASSTPFTHETPSVVGSISKTWTALTILRLHEWGFLELDDPISDHLPSVSEAWENITIRELLSHTSGLQRTPSFHPSYDTELGLSQLFGSLIGVPWIGMHPLNVYFSYLQTDPVGFKPGATAEYSNLGYLILGAIVDNLTKNSGWFQPDYDAYESAAWRLVGQFDGNFINNDQMLSPSLNEYWRHSDIPNLAKGYTWNGSGYVHTTYFNSLLLQIGPAGWEGPAGGWTMTIGDLVRLMMAIQNNEIISEELKEQEMMQVYGMENNGNRWGLGVNLIKKLDRPVYMHDGSYPGFRARYTVWPEEDFGVAILSNESKAGMRDLTNDIASVFLTSDVGGESVVHVDHAPDSDPCDIGDYNEVGVAPRLTLKVRDQIMDQLRQSQRLQIQKQADRHRLEEELRKDGKMALAEKLLKRYGIETVEPFIHAFESARDQEDFSRRILDLTNGMRADRKITSFEAREIQAGARVTYRYWFVGDFVSGKR